MSRKNLAYLPRPTPEETEHTDGDLWKFAGTDEQGRPRYWCGSSCRSDNDGRPPHVGIGANAVDIQPPDLLALADALYDALLATERGDHSTRQAALDAYWDARTEAQR